MKYKLNDKVQINLKAIKEDCPSEHYIKTITPYEGMTAEIEQVCVSRYLIKFEDEHRFVVLENWIKPLEEVCTPE